jgi:nitroreductase
MTGDATANGELPGLDTVRAMRRVRQIRQFHETPVPDAVLHEILETARWTSSARNLQPWHFIVIQDREQLVAISEINNRIGWVAGGALAIAVVMDGEKAITEYFDEGRVTERILLAAHFLGLGGGTAWFDEPDQQARGRAVLGVPEGYVAKAVIVLGYPRSRQDPRPNAAAGGRKALAEIVGYGKFPGGE